MALILLVVFASVAVWRVMATRQARTRSPERQPSIGSPVAGFAAWALAGLLGVAAAFTILSIGVFLAPLPVVALWVAAWISPDLQALSGVLVGAGLFAVVVSIAGAPSGAERVVWSLAGLASIALGIAGYLVLRQRSPSAAG